MSAADISEKKRTVCFRKLPLSSVVCWGSVVLFFLLFVAFFRGWLPVFPVAIATGSMEPSIQIGDAVILCQADPVDLQTGDIIRYEKNGKSVIHRIVDIRETKNGENGIYNQRRQQHFSGYWNSPARGRNRQSDMYTSKIRICKSLVKRPALV